jgi:hypothetical protein
LGKRVIRAPLMQKKPGWSAMKNALTARMTSSLMSGQADLYPAWTFNGSNWWRFQTRCNGPACIWFSYGKSPFYYLHISTLST